MKRILKRVLIALLAAAVTVAAVFGGMILIRNAQRKPVSVYEAQGFAITEYWGDSSVTQGNVTLEGMQRVEVSDTATVTEILVNQGQWVQKGDPLATYDTTLTSLDLEKAQIAVERQKLSITTMEKELDKLYAMRPSSGQPTIIEPTYDYVDPALLPELLTPITPDLGSEENPIVILWDRENPVKVQELIDTVKGLDLLRVPVTPTPVPTATPVPEEGSDAPPAPEATPAPEIGESPVPDVTPAPDVTQVPEGETDSTPAPDETQAPEGGTDPTPEPEIPETGELCVVVLVRVGEHGNARNGSTAARYGFTMLLEGEGNVSDLALNMDLPIPETVPEEAMPIIIPDKGSGYSSSELAKMRSDKEIQIRDAKLALEIAELDLKKKEQEMGDGTIRAEMDGVIKTVNDPALARETGEPLLIVSAGGGYYITGYLSEWELGTVGIGQSVSVNSWMSGGVFEGEIREISDIPMSGNRYYGTGQENVSYYPFRVFVPDTANLQEGEYVEMTYAAATDAGEYFYLEKMFIRTENGKSYCMVKGEDGTLEKRFIRTGADLWGSYTQIRGGLELTDRVAFPYGQDVVPGAKTEDREPMDFYQSMNY